MSIVDVDSRRRIYIPKRIPFKAEKVIILPHGSSFLLIPIPEKISEIHVDTSIEKLKRRVEEKARQETRTFT